MGGPSLKSQLSDKTASVFLITIFLLMLALAAALGAAYKWKSKCEILEGQFSDYRLNPYIYHPTP